MHENNSQFSFVWKLSSYKFLKSKIKEQNSNVTFWTTEQLNIHSPKYVCKNKWKELVVKPCKKIT